MPDLTTPILGLTEPTVGADNGTWGGFLNTDLVNLDTYIGVLRQAAKAVTVGATTTCDFNAPASVFSFTVNQATLIAFANVPANITAQQLSVQATLIITNGGAFAVTWPASVTWVGGLGATPPVLQTAGVDIVLLWSPNNGTNWYGAVLPNPAALQRVLSKSLGASTGSFSEVSLGGYLLPGSTLANAADAVRVTVIGRKDFGAAAAIRVKFGAAYVLNVNGANNVPSATGFVATAVIARATAATQVANGSTAAGAAVLSEGSLPGETLANPVQIDVRGFVVGGTLNVDAIIVEALK